jgi:ribosomal protein S18 acetylase RimI-like enzyme
MTDIRVREAKEPDLPSIEKLVKELIKSLGGTEAITVQQAVNNCKNLLKEANSYVYVSEIDGDVVGFINFTTRKTILHQGLSGLIDELVVNEGYQRKGVGKRLVLTAREKCKQLGCCEIEVNTEKTNNKAREFYKKYGFKKRGFLFEMQV